MLGPKDVAVTIPTYNRSEDVDRTLAIMIKNKNIPGKIYVVDQSKDDKTEKAVKKYSSRLPVQYIKLKNPSSAIAENTGVGLGIKSYKLQLILGDDVDLLPGYFRNLVKEFNDHPELMGLGGADQPEKYNMNSLKNIISRIYLSFFLLPHRADHKYLILSPYGNTASPKVTKDIRDAQWIPGVNNCFRTEIYKEYRFPEIKGYNLLEDIDCSYRVYQKYGEGSLLVTPKCRVIHRWSQAARYPEKKRIFANHEDHFSFYYRHFSNPAGTIKMIWALTGIVLGNTFRLFSFDKKSLSNLIYNLQAIGYCFKNRKKIKSGKYRLFLNDDLTMRSDL